MEGCVEFSSSEVCDRCESNYYRQYNGLCRKYSDDLGCLDFNPEDVYLIQELQVLLQAEPYRQVHKTRGLRDSGRD